MHAGCRNPISLIKSPKVCLIEHGKGQLISKCLFGIFNSPKKRTKKLDSTTMDYVRHGEVQATGPLFGLF